VKGAVHARVDKGKGHCPRRGAGEKEGEETKPAVEADEIHSRSVMLGRTAWGGGKDGSCGGDSG